jgi:hypothetical protein
MSIVHLKLAVDALILHHTITNTATLGFTTWRVVWIVPRSLFSSHDKNIFYSGLFEIDHLAGDGNNWGEDLYELLYFPKKGFKKLTKQRITKRIGPSLDIYSFDKQNWLALSSAAFPRLSRITAGSACHSTTSIVAVSSLSTQYP